MTTNTISSTHKPATISRLRWLQIGLQAAFASILVVLAAQAAILAVRPDLATFKPLDNYGRSALFTFIPAMAATLVFAWLVKNQSQPEKKFVVVSIVVLLLSFVPDYLLPIPDRTFLASTAAAFLHLLAGIVTVTVILVAYSRSGGRAGKKA